MVTPTPIGLVHFDEPRAVKVREPENLDATHSAIHSGINIYTDSVSQANYLMEHWSDLMADLSDSVDSLLQAMPVET